MLSGMIYTVFSILVFLRETMPVENIWPLEPGEYIVAEKTMKKLKCKVYFPVRDTDMNLLTVSTDKHVEVQVKENTK